MDQTSKTEKHFVATGFVLNKEQSKMLVVYHRKLDKWAAPGGHIELNETPAEAALREIFEETGVKATVVDSANVELCPRVGSEAQLDTPYVMLSEHIPKYGDNKAHIHLDFIFLCEADENEALVQQEREVKKVKWMTWEELEKVDTFDSIKNFAKIMLDATR